VTNGTRLQKNCPAAGRGASPVAIQRRRKRGAYLRRYAYEFIELFAPHLPRALVEPAVRGARGSQYEL
jgi:hypothetical protein